MSQSKKTTSIIIPVTSMQVNLRSSLLEVFCKKDVLRNFTKFTGKHLFQNLLFNKAAGLRHATLLKKRLWHRCFPMNFTKLQRKPFLTELFRWQLLNFLRNGFSPVF